MKLQLNNVASVFDYMSELAFALLFVVAGLPDYAVHSVADASARLAVLTLSLATRNSLY